MKRKNSAYWAVSCWLGLALLGYGLQPLVTPRRSSYSERMIQEHILQRSLLIEAENASIVDRQRLLDLFLPEASSFELVPARLIPSGDLSPLRRSALIDRGTESRLAPGMGVIGAQGIVGEIYEVGDGWSRVQLVDDPAFVVPVQDEQGLRGILSGGPGRGAGHPKLRLDPMLLAEGDLLYTDGSAGVFPPSIYIGIVEESRIPVRESVIRLPAGLDLGQEVLVLTPLDDGGPP